MLNTLPRLSRQTKRSIDGGSKSHRSTFTSDSPSWTPSIPEVVVSRYVSLLLLGVSRTSGLVGTAKTTKFSAVGKYRQSVSLFFCVSCYRILTDNAQRNIRPISLALAHLPPTLLRRISLITNGACQSSIKFGLRGRPRPSALLAGLIPEAHEAMQVPNQDISTGAEANMRAMG